MSKLKYSWGIGSFFTEEFDTAKPVGRRSIGSLPLLSSYDERPTKFRITFHVQEFLSKRVFSFLVFLLFLTQVLLLPKIKYRITWRRLPTWTQFQSHFFPVSFFELLKFSISSSNFLFYTSSPFTDIPFAVYGLTTALQSHWLMDRLHYIQECTKNQIKAIIYSPFSQTSVSWGRFYTDSPCNNMLYWFCQERAV